MRVSCVNVFFLSVLFVHGHVNDVVETGEHSLELTQSLNLARQELIQETCMRFPPRLSLDELPLSQLEHILVDEEHKLLYCYVPKVSFKANLFRIKIIKLYVNY